MKLTENAPVTLAEIWRGEILESIHTGHAVVCDERGEIIEAWGEPDQIIFPRSSCKMIQALPLLDSGAADQASLGTEQLALACASHQGAAMHVTRVKSWLEALGYDDSDLRCGPQLAPDIEERNRLIRAHEEPCQCHNNCSGKHAGFLTLNKHMGGEAEYVEPDHPLQIAVKDAFEEVTQETSPGFGIDGCSAPNFATSVHGLARSMAFFAAAREGTGTRETSAARLVEAMVTHPELVAGTTRACTELMQAMGGRVAIKTGADGVFTAILPEQKLGVALKVTDGATRASECAIAAILVKLGVLDANHPATLRRMNAPMVNRRGIKAASIKPGSALV
ncbi:asparaginase [Halocynthiibacter sp. C4]|uniref:asparaginase n=1 Tax=Halocynthiibacter sp. C4 TaxID=2992758 RepID=UPI00237B39C8|nr:asparaginase [Halocynthiibacter sp. C4]MDE0591399.1 asparaginase [Halocynthiibacter sp. C4]